jgi:activator of HSP90 ATPase
MKTLTQKVLFKNTMPEQLYELYMDAKLHATVTNHAAKISKAEGTPFSVFRGSLTGKILKLIPNKLIVQTWRANDWKKSDLDSIFMLHLEEKGKDTVLNMVHTNLPDNQAKNIKSGWTDFYWTPWKAYLSGKKVPKKKSM